MVALGAGYYFFGEAAGEWYNRSLAPDDAVSGMVGNAAPMTFAELKQTQPEQHAALTADLNPIFRKTGKPSDELAVKLGEDVEALRDRLLEDGANGDQHDLVSMMQYRSDNLERVMKRDGWEACNAYLIDGIKGLTGKPTFPAYIVNFDSEWAAFFRAAAEGTDALPESAQLTDADWTNQTGITPEMWTKVHTRDPADPELCQTHVWFLERLAVLSAGGPGDRLRTAYVLNGMKP